MPRLIIGSNWFLGYSHTSLAKDRFIKEFQTRDRIADIIEVYLNSGIDAVMGPFTPLLGEAADEAEQRTGKKVIRVITPSFNITPGGDPEQEPERVFDNVKALGATFCMPHQCVTDALIDRRAGEIRDINIYTKMIRERGMIPGLSTHMPEAITLSDSTDADIETYIQIYNSSGFLMQVEVDWIMRVIRDAKKPVMTIKPLAAGRILPPVGLAFVWNTIREQDMVTIGTTTPDEAREVIDLSIDFLEGRIPDNPLQKTRSKNSLTYGQP